MFRSFTLSREIALVQATVVVWITDIGPSSNNVSFIMEISSLVRRHLDIDTGCMCASYSVQIQIDVQIFPPIIFSIVLKFIAHYCRNWKHNEFVICRVAINAFIEKIDRRDVINAKIETLCNKSVFVSCLLIQCHAIIWTADELMLLAVLGTRTSKIWLIIKKCSTLAPTSSAYTDRNIIHVSKKAGLMSFAKRQPSCPSLNGLNTCSPVITYYTESDGVDLLLRNCLE